MDAVLSRSFTERVAPLLRVAREAAASDPELARVLDAIKALAEKRWSPQQGLSRAPVGFG